MTTNREPATLPETVAAATAAVDQAEAELRNLRAHLSVLVMAGTPSATFCASRVAAIISTTTAQISTQLRDQAARQSATIDGSPSTSAA